MSDLIKDHGSMDSKLPDDYYLQMKKDESTGELKITATKKSLVTWLHANILSPTSFKLVQIARSFSNKNVSMTPEQRDAVLFKIKTYIQSNKFQKLPLNDQHAIQTLYDSLKFQSIYELVSKAFVGKFELPVHQDVAPSKFQIETLRPPEHGQDLLAAARPFIAEKLNISVADFTIERVQGGLSTGLTGVPVFLIKDKNGELLAVLKEFDTETLLTQEHDNREQMAKFQGDEYSVVDILGAAKCESTYLLLQSPAQGQPISKMFEASNTPDGFTLLVNAMVGAAKGLAALHQKSKVARPERQGKINYVAGQFEVGKNVALGLRHLNREFLERIQATPLQTYDGALVHGDFQPGNIFIDSNGHPTIIDLDSVTEGGFPAYDVAYFSMWIAVEGHRNGLTNDQIMTLRQKFEDTYLAGVDNEKIHEELDYMRVYICLERLQQIQPGGQFYEALGQDLANSLTYMLLNELERLQGGPSIPSFDHIKKIMEKIEKINAQGIKVR